MGLCLKCFGSPLRGKKLNSRFISCRISEANFDECSLGNTSRPGFRGVWGDYNNRVSRVSFRLAREDLTIELEILALLEGLH